MKKTTQYVGVELDRELARKFKELVKSNGYSQKFVIEILIKAAMVELEKKDFNRIGGLFNAEKRD